MKAKVKGQNLSYIAALAARTAGGKSEPVEAHRYAVLMAEPGRVSVSAGRYEIRLLAHTEAEVAEAGAVAIPARLFGDLIGYLADQDTVSIHVEPPLTLRVEGGNSVSRLKGVDAEVALPLPPFSEDTAVVVEANALAQALEQTLFAAGDGRARPILGGVLISPEQGQLRLAASDGFRLSEAVIPLMSPAASGQVREAVVSAEALSTVAALAAKAQAGEAVGVSLPPPSGNKPANRWAVFQLPGARVCTAVVEGQYPEYKPLIPSNAPLARAEVGKDDLARAARRLVALAESRQIASAPAARVTFEAGGLWVRDNPSDEQERASSSALDAQVSGGPIDIGLNALYVAQACQAAPTARVVLECHGPQRPLIVKPAGAAGWLHLIMPIRL